MSLAYHSIQSGTLNSPLLRTSRASKPFTTFHPSSSNLVPIVRLSCWRLRSSPSPSELLPTVSLLPPVNSVPSFPPLSTTTSTLVLDSGSSSPLVSLVSLSLSSSSLTPPASTSESKIDTGLMSDRVGHTSITVSLCTLGIFHGGRKSCSRGISRMTLRRTECREFEN